MLLWKLNGAQCSAFDNEGNWKLVTKPIVPLIKYKLNFALYRPCIICRQFISCINSLLDENYYLLGDT